jgi:hypothetical protein
LNKVSTLEIKIKNTSNKSDAMDIENVETSIRLIYKINTSSQSNHFNFICLKNDNSLLLDEFDGDNDTSVFFNELNIYFCDNTGVNSISIRCLSFIQKNKKIKKKLIT